MGLAETVYVWACRVITGLAGAATLYAVWMLHATTFAPERLFMAEAYFGLTFAANVFAVAFPGALAVALVARILAEFPIPHVSDMEDVSEEASAD